MYCALQTGYARRFAYRVGILVSDRRLGARLRLAHCLPRRQRERRRDNTLSVRRPTAVAVAPSRRLTARRLHRKGVGRCERVPRAARKATEPVVTRRGDAALGEDEARKEERDLQCPVCRDANSSVPAEPAGSWFVWIKMNIMPMCMLVELVTTGEPARPGHACPPPGFYAHDRRLHSDWPRTHANTRALDFRTCAIP